MVKLKDFLNRPFYDLHKVAIYMRPDVCKILPVFGNVSDVKAFFPAVLTDFR